MESYDETSATEEDTEDEEEIDEEQDDEVGERREEARPIDAERAQHLSDLVHDEGRGSGENRRVGVRLYQPRKRA